MVDQSEYMSAGFDPSSLKVAQLRGILVEHQVSFSSAARKSDLVDLFVSKVLPKAVTLRKKNATIVPSSSGIIDMRDRRSDAEETPVHTPAKRKVGRPRQSEAATPARAARSSSKPPVNVHVSESPEEAQETPEPPKKRGRPRKSAPAAVSTEVSDSEQDARNRSDRHVSFGPESPQMPSTRRAGRLSRASAGGSKSDDDGAFSDTNPFQSGSEASPGPASTAAASSARKARRKTTDGSSLRHKTSVERLQPSSPPFASSPSPSAPSRFRNYMDQTVAASTPPRNFSRLTSRSPGASSYAADDEDVEEYEETLFETTVADMNNGNHETMSPSAMARKRTDQRQKDRARRKHHGASRSGWDMISDSMWTLLCVGLFACTLWYSKETRALGFCDTGSATNTILEERRVVSLAEAREHNTTIEEFSVLPARLQPSCTPCPPHANCAYGQVLGCASDDWVLQPNLRSKIPLVSWVLPLGYTQPRCYPDTQKLVLASELSLAISHMLAEFKGEIVCGTQKPHATVRKLPKRITSDNGNLTYAIAEEAVKRSMSATRESKVDDDYFEQIWYMALFELTDPRSNVVRVPVSTTSGMATNESLATTFFLAAKQPALSISCRSRLALRGWLRRARLYLFMALSLASSFVYLRYRLSATRAENHKVSLLVQSAFDKLQEQEYMHGVDPVLYPDDFVALSHLRDHILAEEHDAKARNRLWKKVVKIVEENSNVRTRQAQKKGEWLRVWQWIGVVDSYRIATPGTTTPNIVV